MNKIIISVFVLLSLSSHSTFAQIKSQQNLMTFNKSELLIKTNSSIGIRAGIGTDINLGLAYGGGINSLLDLHNNAF